MASGITVRDVMNADQLKCFKLLAGAGGLDNRVAKVGILDFEFAEGGQNHCVPLHWAPNEFVLSTLLYAKGGGASLLEAVKALSAARVSGMAIKNVFSLEISKDVLRFADENNFPIFIQTEDTPFFEDIIIYVNELIKSVLDHDAIGRKIDAILTDDIDGSQVKRLALEINHAFRNTFLASYFIPKDSRDQEQNRKLFLLISRKAEKFKGSGASIAGYRGGFFYILSEDNVSKIDPDAIVRNVCASIGLKESDFFVGRSEMLTDLSHLKKVLTQGLYASSYSRIFGRGVSDYRDLGVYQILFPSMNEEWTNDFYAATTARIAAYDAESDTNLLPVMLKYEEAGGNIRDVASHFFTHENTIRYRLGKIKKLFGPELSDREFSERLAIAAKIHRIKAASSDD